MKLRIPIKKFVPEDYDTVEERYEALLKHHEEETKFLISHIEELESGHCPRCSCE